MMYRRYYGEFLSLKGHVISVSILQEAEEPFPAVGGLDFPAAAPLRIEWTETSKEEPICGSVATLTVISPGDRTYEDLYSVAPGRIRMDVRRDGALYWSGCLDPEFYEEPYSSGKDYDVELTFSDFGILKRLAYGLEDMHSLRQILETALGLSKINYVDLDESLTSTWLDEENRMTLSSLSVRSENFYDEDGVPMDYHEVISGILQPLALKMVQRAGTIYVYDINALYESSLSSGIVWCSNDQMLGVDKVANNARVTLSAYSGEGMSESIEFTDVIDETFTNITNDVTVPEAYSYYQDYETRPAPGEWDYYWLAFTIFLSQNGKGLDSKYSEAKYFRIVPILGGESSQGLAFWFYTGGHGPLDSGWPVRRGAAASINRETVVMRTKRRYLPGLSPDETAAHKLRLTLNMLMDARYNPFGEAGSGNEEDNDDYLKSNANNVFVPVTVQLYDRAGRVLYHYDNRGDPDSEYDVGWQSVRGRGMIGRTLGKWVEGPAAYDDCCLQWYDPKDKRRTGVTGWKKNRQACGVFSARMFPSFQEMDDGQTIPYPPVAGYIEISVRAGIRIVRETMNHPDITEEILPKVRWCLFQTPELELLKGFGAKPAVEGNEDVEYNGVLNADAKDDISIDTICGTMAEPSPAARGLYCYTSDDSPVITLTRRGRTTQAEQLLIGTLYSQFAERKTKLSGTAELIPGLAGLSDNAQGNKRFMLVGDNQDLRDDSSVITAIEMAPDEYTAENE